jgi:hypothetical protein
MLVLSFNKINELLDRKYKVYSKEPLREGVECYNSSKCFKENEPFCITSVSSRNIISKENRFYYTNEDLNSVADWFPAHIINVSNNFTPCKKSKKLKCVKQVDSNVGKCVGGVIDATCLPAFNGINEDISVNEYRLYITLFNEYTVKQCIYDRRKLYDALFKSSKYDLPYKLQNSDFLKSKDFVAINIRRKKEENVPVGLIIKMDEDSQKRNIEYGTVYINMDNRISVVWH